MGEGEGKGGRRGGDREGIPFILPHPRRPIHPTPFLDVPFFNVCLLRHPLFPCPPSSTSPSSTIHIPFPWRPLHPAPFLDVPFICPFLNVPHPRCPSYSTAPSSMTVFIDISFHIPLPRQPLSFTSPSSCPLPRCPFHLPLSPISLSSAPFPDIPFICPLPTHSLHLSTFLMLPSSMSLFLDVPFFYVCLLRYPFLPHPSSSTFPSSTFPFLDVPFFHVRLPPWPFPLIPLPPPYIFPSCSLCFSFTLPMFHS